MTLEETIKNILPECKSGSLYDEYDNYVEIYHVLSKLAQEYLDKSDILLRDIIDDDIEDSERQVIFECTNKRTVNISKLPPDIFDKIVFIKDADAAQIIGRSVLRDMIRDKLKSASDEMLTANVTELEKLLGKTDALKYIDIEPVKGKVPMIVKKDSYPRDYYGVRDEHPTAVFASELNVKAPKPVSGLKF